MSASAPQPLARADGERAGGAARHGSDRWLGQGTCGVCGATGLERLQDGKTGLTMLFVLGGEPHHCPTKPLPDWHECRSCERPVFSFEGRTSDYDDMFGAQLHHCQAK